jgi:hypothetical protein
MAMEWGLGWTISSGMRDGCGLFIGMGPFFEWVHYTKKPCDGEQNRHIGIEDVWQIRLEHSCEWFWVQEAELCLGVFEGAWVGG